MLALQRMFASDHADGTLEQMLLGATPLGMIVGAKVLAHWLVSGLPLVLISPVLALQFDFPQELLGVLALSLALGTPVLSLIGAIGAALTLGLRVGRPSRAAGAAPLCSGAGHRSRRSRSGGLGARRAGTASVARCAPGVCGGFRALAAALALRISTE